MKLQYWLCSLSLCVLSHDSPPPSAPNSIYILVVFPRSSWVSLWRRLNRVSSHSVIDSNRWKYTEMIYQMTLFTQRWVTEKCSDLTSLHLHTNWRYEIKADSHFQESFSSGNFVGRKLPAVSWERSFCKQSAIIFNFLMNSTLTSWCCKHQQQ